MKDYADQIKDFLNKFFKPEIAVMADLKMETTDLLNFLFRSFPENCITEYELIDILYELGYEQQVYIITSFHVVGDKEIEKKTLSNGWCLKSYYDLM